VIVVKRTQTDEIPATLREGRVPADHLLDRNERLQAIDLSFRERFPFCGGVGRVSGTDGTGRGFAASRRDKKSSRLWPRWTK